MIISDWAVNNRTTVFFLTVAIIIFGLVSYITLPRESSPDIPIPFVFITTNYRGGSPEDIEQLITIPIEDKLKGLSGVKEIKSVSQEDMSIISVEFETGVNIDDVLPKVKDKVDLAKMDLPNDLEDDPVIEEMNFSEMPVLIIGLAGDFGEQQLGKLADDLKDELEGIPGVLEAELAGKVDREIQIQVYPERLTQYKLPVQILAEIIKKENINVSGGSIRLPQGRFQLRVPGEFNTPDEANELVVAVNNNGPVYLRDIGFVTDGIADRDTDSRVNGKSSITLSIKKRAGANVIEIVDAIDAKISEMRRGWPKGLRVTRLMDRSKEIKNMVKDLENNILSGLVLVIIIVCIAMGIRNSIIVSLSIPLSMLMSFSILKMLGITLNMVVLFSLTLALGMLVDNAIVIVENIYRFMQQGVPRREAAMRATSEVAWPIIGSAATTIAAFIPLLAWDGIMGEFMVYLPKTVIITLISCLFVAMIINPAIAATLMKVSNPGGKRVSADDVMSAGEHPMLEGGGIFLNFYRKALRLALGNRLAVIASAGGLVLLAMMFWFNRVGLKTPVELFPSPDPKDIYVNFNMPQGCGLKYADDLIKSVATRIYSEKAAKGEKVDYEKAIAPKEHVEKLSGRKYYSPSWLPNIEYAFEKSSFRPGRQFFGNGSDNQIGLHCVDLEQRVEKSTDTMKRIDAMVKDVAGAEITVEKAEEGPPTGKPINIEITGSDFKTLGQLAEKAKQYVQRVPFTTNVRSDYESGSPTLKIDVDRKRSAFLGFTTDYIGFVVKAAFNGMKVSNFREADEKFDLVVRFDDKNRSLIDTLRKIFLYSEKYGNVPLTTVARIEYTGGLGRITRINNRRVVTVSADVDNTKTTGAVALDKVKEMMAGSSLLTGAQIKDWDKLLAVLKDASAGKAGVGAARVWQYLPGDAVEVVNSWDTGKKLSAKQKAVLIGGINSELVLPDLYVKDSFDISTLPADIGGILQNGSEFLQYMDSGELERVNRALVASALGQVVGEPEIDAFHMPPGYSYTFTGEDKEMAKALSFLKGALLTALLLILLVLVAQFDSIVYPFVIMSAVLLSIGGVFLGLGVADMPFSLIMTGVGVISLAGVVVNNAIVLVDYILQLQKRGMALNEAIIAAGSTRLRPVLLTAITTILGLIPMAMGWSFDFSNGNFQWESESSQWWGAMAIPVIFGLLVATALTLMVVPVLFSLATGLRDFIVHFGYYLIKIHVFLGYNWIRLYDYLFKTSIAEQWKQQRIKEIASQRK